MNIGIMIDNKWIQDNLRKTGKSQAELARHLRRDECVGTVIAGVCHGTIIPKQAVRPRCYGQMLNGVCTGALQ
jgi:hypothetical protein